MLLKGVSKELRGCGKGESERNAVDNSNLRGFQKKKETDDSLTTLILGRELQCNSGS